MIDSTKILFFLSPVNRQKQLREKHDDKSKEDVPIFADMRRPSTPHPTTGLQLISNPKHLEQKIEKLPITSPVFQVPHQSLLSATKPLVKRPHTWVVDKPSSDDFKSCRKECRAAVDHDIFHLRNDDEMVNLAPSRHVRFSADVEVLMTYAPSVYDRSSQDLASIEDWDALYEELSKMRPEPQFLD